MVNIIHFKACPMKEILAILFFLWLVNTVTAQVNDEESIKKNFEKYLSAMGNGKGEEAAGQVDSHTIQYYNHIAELARDADSLKVESLSLMDKIMVLLVRHRVPKEDLLKFDGKALFMYAIDNGMINKGSVVPLKLETVIVDKDTAKGQINFKEVDYPLYLNFYKEEGQWKYDLTSSFAIAMPALQKYVDELGEKFLINMMLHADKQKIPDPYIWRPVR